MYEENWKRKHDPYTLFYMHEIVSWFEMLMFKVAMEEIGELSYVLPVSPPLHLRCTYLFLKPMEQLFLYGTTQTLMFPRVLHSETANISDETKEMNESGWLRRINHGFNFMQILIQYASMVKREFITSWKTW